VATNSSLAARPREAATAGAGKRERLVAAARELVHRQGIARTTLADIAHAAAVPVGNVYYYFKTKDEIISAVVDAHADGLRAAFAELERHHPAPADRLAAFVALQADWAGSAPPQYGCPYGTLSSELAKQTAAPDPLAATLLQLQLDWVEQQFRAMGLPNPGDLAVQLLAAWQGCAVLAGALGQSELMADQARRLQKWVTDLDT
jgi:TetR/AcrR family transcriptional regulator, transcriptional repressor for nem operon